MREGLGEEDGGGRGETEKEGGVEGGGGVIKEL